MKRTPLRSFHSKRNFFVTNLNEIYLPPVTFELHPYHPVNTETGKAFENIEDFSDVLHNYGQLKQMYQNKLQRFLRGTWKVDVARGYIVFYTIDLSDIPKIPSSVKIDSTMHASITLDDRIMDPVDLTWILPISGKLDKWSQLQKILSIFVKN